VAKDRADFQALRIPDNAGFKVRYPILNRTLNRRDWNSSQQLLDDIEIILQEALKTELGILPRDYPVSRLAVTMDSSSW
jgi:actin-related protein 8